MMKGKRVYNFGLVEDVFDIVVDESAKAFDCTPTQIKSESRFGHIVAARHVAMHALWNNSNATKAELARRFNRNHASIIHAIKSIDDRLQFDRSFKERYQNAYDLMLIEIKTQMSGNEASVSEFLSLVKDWSEQKGIDLMQCIRSAYFKLRGN